MTTSFDRFSERIRILLERRNRLVIALDGCCASGKTTLARRLAQQLPADVIPMDDFFLPPFLRTPARLAQPGGNVHYERFYEQVIAPLLSFREKSLRENEPASKGWPVLSWDRFDCSSMDFLKEPRITAGRPC